MPTMKKKKKSRGEAADGVLVNEENLTEPTMGEKLASLNLIQNDKPNSDDSKIDDPKGREDQPEPSSSLLVQPPSADSVQVLLRQALRADDRVLLLDCLYNRDEKVIAKSVSLLNPADVLKLLQSLVSVIQSRAKRSQEMFPRSYFLQQVLCLLDVPVSYLGEKGAVLACAVPWLRNLLLQHASGIMSQESSLLALNSLFQLIESRVSTFESAIQLSSCLDILYTGVVDDEVDENDIPVPVVYEDKDESDEEESEDAMETDQDSEDGNSSDEALDGVSDIEGSDGMMD
ncbi:hypothetical protein CJ030_MR3G026545 [Morella rubra]|uniref:Small-subunit processome Utp12 domain-containing protein n=1 Tax=Morella rubra TaxID=262757 RepID=A0A6A1W0Q1_9ROSI|nr:hypothetical protein CJ030_MR3G026534 [Morella rubra]KAB1218665.1 hypothetical protein CJ030_MR3G026545 [Morella rubra]